MNNTSDISPFDFLITTADNFQICNLGTKVCHLLNLTVMILSVAPLCSTHNTIGTEHLYWLLLLCIDLILYHKTGHFMSMSEVPSYVPWNQLLYTIVI